jgi:hypothetical protein
MSNFKESKTLHKQAASFHEAAAFLHHVAAQHHSTNNFIDAKTYSKNAMECSASALRNSTKACVSSAH